MRLLHLSDLHVTEQGQNLATTFLRVNSALSLAGEGPFDFLIVSGDLTQRASPAEYTELKAFAETQLLRLLAKQDRARIVFVPGNHDVDWSSEVAGPLRLAAPDTDLTWVQRELERYHAQPEHSELRLQIGKLGHLDLLKIDPARYPQRLRNVQGFFDAFYGDALSARGGRGFRLLEKGPHEHFSAHLFPDEGVAFFGFSSLHRNDRYYTGASISAEAIAAASELGRALDPGLLRVAVWHHGFSSERGRPDSLTLQDVGTLHAAGFRVGFHGHTHRDGAQLADLLEERFAIVSTGSYGAASGDRPDAVGNQFSVVRLNASSVVADVYEKQGEAGTYHRIRRRSHALTAVPERAPGFVRTWAERHRRGFRVRKDGIARASVELENFTCEPDLPLAIVSRPFCDVIADESAAGPLGQVPVRRELREDGHIAFLLHETAPRLHRQLSWSYHVSNALSLDRAELQLLESRQRWYPNLPADHDLCCHTARFQSDRLELELEYERDTGATLESAFPLVERQQESGGEVRWVRAADEERRCTLIGQGTSRALLSVSGPQVGHRYGIAFRLAQAGQPYPAALEMNAAELLKECLGREPGGSAPSLATTLTELCEGIVKGELEEDGKEPALGKRTTLMGMLWDGQRRLLRPAFGRFWTQSWGARFACGEGVAGHSFRFAVPAAWHIDGASARRDSSIIYQPYPQHYVQARHYRWVLSLPLKANERTCIGVITLASEDEEVLPAERRLGRAARVTALGIDDPGTTALLGRLQVELAAAFWMALIQSPAATEALREYAGAILKTMKR